MPYQDYSVRDGAVKSILESTPAGQGGSNLGYAVSTQVTFNFTPEGSVIASNAKVIGLHITNDAAIIVGQTGLTLAKSSSLTVMSPGMVLPSGVHTMSWTQNTIDVKAVSGTANVVINPMYDFRIDSDQTAEN